MKGCDTNGLMNQHSLIPPEAHPHTNINTFDTKEELNNEVASFEIL